MVLLHGGAGDLQQPLRRTQLLVGRLVGRDVAPDAFGHRVGGAVILRVGHPEAGRDPLLGRVQFGGGVGEGLQRDHRAAVGVH